MPAAFNQDVSTGLGQQLAWDNEGQQYVSVNVTVNIPPGYQQQQQQQGQMQVLTQPAHPSVLQQWHVNNPVPEQQSFRLQPQQVQHSPVAQPGLNWTHLEQRPDQIPFWQSPQTVTGSAVAGGTVVAAAAPNVQHVQLQHGTLVAAAPQQLTGVLQLQPQLQTQVLQYVPQQLQEVSTYALILLPPGTSVIDPQQQLQLQPVMVPQELLAQTAAAGLQAAPAAAHRKTRRGPNRGRSKQKQAEQQTAAEAGQEAAAQPGSLQDSQTQQQLKPVRVTSASSSSGATADSNSYTGSGVSGSQGGSADSGVSAGEAGIGSPDKKRVRRRGRRGKKGSQDAQDSQPEQGEGQALAEPWLPGEMATAAADTAAAATGSGGGGASSRAGKAGSSAAAAAGQAGAAQQQQQPKRTSGLSHRQRYRRKQWELHRAMEQQQAEAEAQARLQAQQLMMLQGQGRVQVLATPQQQLPAMWQELQGSQLAAAQQLQGSPMQQATSAASAGLMTAGQLLGSPVAAGLPTMVAAAVPPEAQRAQLLAAAAAAAGVRPDSTALAAAAQQMQVSGASAVAAPLAAGAAAGAGQAAGPSWAPGSQQQQRLEAQAAEGAAHVDQNLDEWLSKLLEL
jgi:hypothetical protein